MKRKRSTYDFLRQGSIAPLALGASVLIGFITFIGLVVAPSVTGPAANIRIEPQNGMAQVGEEFTIALVVESSVPTNVFGGEVQFNSDVLRVTTIDYNTSVADLWAERPWFSNGAGTLNFIGGTTRPGGFTGSETLIAITFKTLAAGEGVITLNEMRVLKHDGLGTDAELDTPLDAVYTVTDPQEVVAETKESPMPTTLHIVQQAPSTDINGDGKQTIADVSAFMIDLARKNLRSDFNMDGSVNTKDLSILLQAE